MTESQLSAPPRGSIRFRWHKEAALYVRTYNRGPKKSRTSRCETRVSSSPKPGIGIPIVCFYISHYMMATSWHAIAKKKVVGFSHRAHDVMPISEEMRRYISET